MNNSLVVLESKKLSEIETINNQIRNTLKSECKLKIGSVDLTDKDVITFYEL